MVGYGSSSPVGGLHDSMTSAGPEQGAIDPRQQVALAMLQQQLARTQAMGKPGLMGLAGQRQTTIDIYGNPVR